MRRWLLPAACLVAPKCALCLLAYAGLGTAFGLGGPELCGAAETSVLPPALLGAAGAAAILFHRFLSRPPLSIHE